MGEIDDMPMAEFLEWQEFYLIEPFGLMPADAMHAHTIRAIAEVNRSEKVRKEPYQLKEFLLFKDSEPEKPKVEPTVDGKTAAQWRMIFAADALNAARRRAQNLENMA